MLTILLCGAVLFILGAAQDWMAAAYIKLAAKEYYVGASILSFVHTLLGYGVFAMLIDSLLTGGWGKLVIYSLGGSVGTFIGLKYTKK